MATEQKYAVNLNTFVIVVGLAFQVALAGWFTRGIYSDVAAQAQANVVQDGNIAQAAAAVQAQAEQITALQGQVTAEANFIHDRTAVADTRNASTDLRLRSLETGQTSVSTDVKNILSAQTEESGDLKQIQTSIASLNTAVALLSQQKGVEPK